jgi:hypothetical protein
MTKYVIHVQLEYTTEEWHSRKHDAKWGYVKNHSQLTKDIAKAKHFATEDEAQDYEFHYNDIMSMGIQEVPSDTH